MAETPFQTRSEESIEASAQRLVLDYDNVLKFRTGDTTPTVKNLTRFQGAGGVVTITDFDDGAQGQVIYILGDGNTTVAHNANIKRAGGSSAVLAADKVYIFMYVNSVWYEAA